MIMKATIGNLMFCLALASSTLAEDEGLQKDIYPRWSVVGEWKATHPYWTDLITFKEDGSFRTGDQQSTGRWVLTAEKGTPLLVLKWDAYGTESLSMVEQNHF